MSPSFLLSQDIFESKFFPYKYPKILKPSHSSYLPAYEDGTECFETSAYQIQTPRNYPEEKIQRVWTNQEDILFRQWTRIVIANFKQQPFHSQYWTVWWAPQPLLDVVTKTAASVACTRARSRVRNQSNTGTMKHYLQYWLAFLEICLRNRRKRKTKIFSVLQ